VADGPGKWVAPVPITFTVISVVLFPAFLLWERRQEKLQKTCIMPLMVWKNKSFAAVCVAVFMAWAAFNGVQYFAALTYLPKSLPIFPLPSHRVMDVALSDLPPTISRVIHAINYPSHSNSISYLSSYLTE
jgi:hypothetical protein